MGGSSSSHAPTVVIRLDQNIAFAGTATPLTGKVYIDVPHKPYSCTKLEIFLQGYESTSVTYTQENKSEPAETKQITAHETRYFLEQPMPLSTVTRGSLAKGNYEFPFQMFIPAGIMTSYKEDNFQIGYRLKACLSNGNSDPKPITSSVDFTVISGMANIPLQPLSFPPTTTAVMFCCCFDRGAIASGALANSSYICPGDNFTIALSAVNSSTASINGISVDILRSSRISAADNNGNHTSESSSVVVNKYKDSASLDSLKLSSAQNPTNSSIVASGPIGGDLIARVNSDISSNKCVLTLPIPRVCCPTYNGLLISVKYEVRIVISTSFFVNNIRMTQPLHMVLRQPESVAYGNSAMPCVPIRPIPAPPVALYPQPYTTVNGAGTTIAPPMTSQPPPYEIPPQAQAQVQPVVPPPAYSPSAAPPQQAIPMASNAPPDYYYDMPVATAVEYSQLPAGWTPITSEVIVLDASASLSKAY